MPEIPRNLPEPPELKKSIGPSFILLGLALGSGELILWPYLSSQYGLGLIWGGLLGITLQFFLNTEAMRYTLAWGESVFVGWRKMSRAIPYWFILSTTIPWALPGFAASTSAISHYLVPALPEKAFAIGLLILTGVIISTGRTLYKTMERIQKTIIMVGLPFITLVTLALVTPEVWLELVRGLVGQGAGWRFFPPGIGIGAFLGAFAYSGAGGNLNLAQSYYIKEKGFGMGRYFAGIKSLLQGKSKEIEIQGNSFVDTAANRSRWARWWRLVNSEHFLVFWVLGLTTILLLAALAAGTARGASAVDINFLFFEAATIGDKTVPLIGTIFLVVAALMLFSTQLGVYESAARITAENVLLAKNGVDKPVNAGRAFYIVLWAEIVGGVALLHMGFETPRALLTIAAILNAAAMMIVFPLILILNKTKLPSFARPSRARQGILLIAFCLFVYFVLETIRTASWV